MGLGDRNVETAAAVEPGPSWTDAASAPAANGARRAIGCRPVVGGVIERTNSWHHRGFNKLTVRTQEATQVIDAFIAMANAVITLRRLLGSCFPHQSAAQPVKLAGGMD